MASLKEYQDYKSDQETLKKSFGTLVSLEEDWKPCISSQFASTMEVSSPCVPCVLVRTSQAINYPKLSSVATTTNISGGEGGMGSSSGSGLKPQER
ncbi:hypothetical protein O181_035531 [Austropuccinia psidii MF-1]|uniref:Uncharacterized protein n=1 Tax=Austropuccinia psidii MF-1 TaxID=1389203 RepID=A0A9Q3D8G1_9BASI|nr:hypothetical protein [Austropuccinia psidii MF-1]